MLPAVSNSPNFKAVILSNDNFTKYQLHVANSIQNHFRQQCNILDKYDTYERRFEDAGFDFVIKPADSRHSVHLDIYRLLNVSKNNPKKIDIQGAYSRVGTYDKAGAFDIEDLKGTEIPPKSNSNWTFLGMITAVIAIVAMPIITNIRKNVNPYYFNSNHVKTDSINRTDTIAKDTLKLVKNIKKIGL